MKDFRVKYNALCDKHTGLILKDAPRLYRKKTSLTRDSHVNAKIRSALSQTNKSEQERINNCAEIIRKQLPDAETGQEKERDVDTQNKTLRGAIDKIGLHDKIRTGILDIWNHKMEKKVKKITKDEQAKEKKRRNAFDAMLAARLQKNENP